MTEHSAGTWRGHGTATMYKVDSADGWGGWLGVLWVWCIDDCSWLSASFQTVFSFSVLLRYPLYLIDVNYFSITLCLLLFSLTDWLLLYLCPTSANCVETLLCDYALNINLDLTVNYAHISILLEHTTGLCKSYEDKHSALQVKLRETSLRRKYFCLSCKEEGKCSD